jgi:WD40 repeat protein
MLSPASLDSPDKSVRSSSNRTYELMRVLPRSVGYVNSLALNADGTLMAIAGDDGKITLWETRSGALAQSFTQHKDAVYAVAFSPDGQVIASAGLDEHIHIWETDSGRERMSLRAHDGWVNALAFTPDGRRLISAGRDSSVRVWDLNTRTRIRQVDDYPSEVFTVAASPDGKLLASDKGNAFCVRELANGRELSGEETAQWGINTVIFNPRNDELMTSGYDGKLWIWSTRKKVLVASVPIAGAPVISLAATGDGRLLAALCSGDASIKLLDTRSWNEIGHLPGTAYPIGSVAFSRDGNILAAGGGDSPVRLWRRRTNRASRDQP